LKHEALEGHEGKSVRHNGPTWWPKLAADGVEETDFIVEEEILLELKSVERLLPVHQAQVLPISSLSTCHRGSS
jgi:PD-(D/E)XK nuclease superfamily